jgi:hypothetical protein
LNLAPGLARRHAFDYWCIMCRTGALTLLVADVHVAGVALVSFLDFDARAPVERVHVRPFGLARPLPDTPHGDLVVDASRLRLSWRGDGAGLRIEGEARPLLRPRVEIDLTIERPPGHESVNVVVPWDETRFHFTSKQQALPARGVVRVGKRAHVFDRESEGFACLDFGRGRWPSGIEWCWAFAAGTRGGRTIGLNLGARWTDGTGVTENGLIIDGRVHKIAEAVDFEVGPRAWRVRTRASARVDLRFTPRRRRHVRVPLGVAGVDLHQCVGVFSGTVIDDQGAALQIDELRGLAETLVARW